ncbi:MAG: response regulator [Opitutaceae bacterium]|nr:response regulator [Opitutaceae bacterium]
MNSARILLIDDDDLFRKATRLTLERAGHMVVEAADGEEGLRRYREGRPDVVILDLIMPGKEGLETIRDLKAHDPAVRILAVSGGGRIDSRDYLPLAQALGAKRILDKPFTEGTLFSVLDELLGGA